MLKSNSNNVYAAIIKQFNELKTLEKNKYLAFREFINEINKQFNSESNQEEFEKTLDLKLGELKSSLLENKRKYDEYCNKKLNAWRDEIHDDVRKLPDTQGDVRPKKKRKTDESRVVVRPKGLYVKKRNEIETNYRPPADSHHPDLARCIETKVNGKRCASKKTHGDYCGRHKPKTLV